MRRFLGGLAAVVFALTLALPALSYVGRGDDNLPCTEGGYWVLNHLDGATPPTITVDGVQATLVKQPNADIAHYESGPVTADSVVVVDPDIGQLQLSHCIGGTEPSATPPTPEPTPTPTPSETSSPTPEPSPTPQVTTPPSGEPTPSPSVEPTPTPTPSASPSPTSTPTPEKSIPIPTPPATDTE